MNNAFNVAEKNLKDNFHPFAVSLLLSLDAETITILQEKQLSRTVDKDPLYLSN